ncbi:hypothetical protein [Ferrovibrio terrae]|uniref:hypothetical protein n=1 Tax=Ferrovibrio terrae TaxID=2594003 RepID=UPI003137ADA6
MAFFVVSYDLHKSRDYEGIITALTGHSGVRLLESFWLISLNNTASQVRDWLKAQVDSDDSLAVIELKAGSDWAGLRTKEDGITWLRQNIKA